MGLDFAVPRFNSASMIIASFLLPFFISLEALALAGPAQSVNDIPVDDTIEFVDLESSFGNETTSVDFSQNEVLKSINSRMAETQTAKGGFRQTDAMGNITTGDFFLRRPGRIRFDYAAPAPYLIVSDGTTVAIEDQDLETIDRAPLSSTPLKHFLKKNLDLATDTQVLDVRTLPDIHLVNIIDKPRDGSDAIDGQVLLMFQLETFDLIGWVSIDGLGNETRVDLIDLETNIKLSPTLFVLEDEDDRDRR